MPTTTMDGQEYDDAYYGDTLDDQDENLTPNSYTSASSDGSKHSKKVQFSDSNGFDLEEQRLSDSTHYPTPVVAEQVVHNSSARRYSIDEVELYFSEVTKFPAAEDDYAVLKCARRNDVIIGGCLGCQETSLLGISRFVTYWAELYNDVMILHKFKDKVEKKRELVPIHGCALRILDVKECLLEVQYKYQGHRKRKLIKCNSKMDVFLWWWALQLASVTRGDAKMLAQAAKKQPLMTIFQLWESTNSNETVLFPKALRPITTRRGPVPFERRTATHLILVRHGETENIHFRVEDRDKRLTVRGREQAAWTAENVQELLKKDGAKPENVTLIFGGLRRTVETAMEFERAMPWLKYKHECCLLEDGAPEDVDRPYRQDFRVAMHRMAQEYICQVDPTDSVRPNIDNINVNYKILICHTSFVQHCIAQSHKVSKDVVRIGAPIGHCSVTQIEVSKDADEPEEMTVTYLNRVQHLPLTHRTSD